jgi:tRNA A37 threonylcarbamoyltransferase TsaD
MAHYTLGIETSCDETSVAVLRDGREILSNIVYSQAHLHEKYGGVVPEVASRNHIKKLPFAVKEALDQAGLDFSDISLVGRDLWAGTGRPALSRAFVCQSYRVCPEQAVRRGQPS